MKKLREQMSPALAISLLALFVALGGGAYAAIGANTVGTAQLKNNAVKEAKIYKYSVTNTKLGTGAVTTSKIRNGQVTRPDIKAGAIGPEKIAIDAVTTEKLPNGAVTANKLASGIGWVVAYAEVNSDGTIAPANSSGIQNSDIGTYGTSIYCLSDLPDFNTMTVTPGIGLTEFDGIVSANADKAPFDEGLCGSFPEAQVAVITYYDDFFGSIAPVQSKKPFTIVLFE